MIHKAFKASVEQFRYKTADLISQDGEIYRIARAIIPSLNLTGLMGNQRGTGERLLDTDRVLAYNRVTAKQDCNVTRLAQVALW